MSKHLLSLTDYFTNGWGVSTYDQEAWKNTWFLSSCHQLHSNSDFFRNSANWEAYTGLEPLLGPTVRQTGELNYQEACTSLVFLEIATATIDWVWSLSCPFYRPFVVISLYWWLVYSNTVNRIKLKIDSYLVNRIILKIGKLSISIL